MDSWPHAPSRIVNGPGTFIVTAGTLGKIHRFDTKERLQNLHDTLLLALTEEGWQTEAWAVFANYYHFVAHYNSSEPDIAGLCKRVHGATARNLNAEQGELGRQIWYRYWDTKVTYEKSYLARLAYVHNNPVKHGLVKDARDYPWCSAKWFTDRGHRPFVQTVMSFKTDRVNVYDDF